MSQEPDTKRGFYYVTVKDAGRTGLLAGPFKDDHAGALAMVGQAKKAAEDANARAVFYAFGTSRSDTDLGQGILNDRLGIA